MAKKSNHGFLFYKNTLLLNNFNYIFSYKQKIIIFFIDIIKSIMGAQTNATTSK